MNRLLTLLLQLTLLLVIVTTRPGSVAAEAITIPLPNNIQAVCLKVMTEPPFLNMFFGDGSFNSFKAVEAIGELPNNIGNFHDGYTHGCAAWDFFLRYCHQDLLACIAFNRVCVDQRASEHFTPFERLECGKE